MKISRAKRMPDGLANARVTLEPANSANVDLLIRWTLDPIAQGPHKRVPSLSDTELRILFLESDDRRYFLIRSASDGRPLGRFYYRAWHFHPDPRRVDWEINILLADPADRGKGLGTAAQRLAITWLLKKPETHSVFAYTAEANVAERRALRRCGLEEVGLLPSPYFRVPLPPQPSVLFVRWSSEVQ